MIHFTFCSAPGRPRGAAGTPGRRGQPRGAALAATSGGTYDHSHPLRGGRVRRQPGRGHTKGERTQSRPAFRCPAQSPTPSSASPSAQHPIAILKLPSCLTFRHLKNYIYAWGGDVHTCHCALCRGQRTTFMSFLFPPLGSTEPYRRLIPLELTIGHCLPTPTLLMPLGQPIRASAPPTTWYKFSDIKGAISVRCLLLPVYGPRPVPDFGVLSLIGFESGTGLIS